VKPCHSTEPAFQREKSSGLNGTFLFTITGQEEVQASIVIGNKEVEVADGHIGLPDLRIIPDSETWLRFLRKEADLLWTLLRRKIRMKGSPRLLLAFRRCFPSRQPGPNEP